ncbi:hypothetical protein JCM17380_10170 [Desulfosporosinus burensis]
MTDIHCMGRHWLWHKGFNWSQNFIGIKYAKIKRPGLCAKIALRDLIF